MLISSDERIQAMIAAMKDGKAWALGLKVGDICFGCAPAAEAAGYARNSAEGRLFIAEAYDVLVRCDIRTDDQGRITGIKRTWAPGMLTEDEAALEDIRGEQLAEGGR
jgi:hypothetical protein